MTGARGEYGRRDAEGSMFAASDMCEMQLQPRDADASRSGHGPTATILIAEDEPLILGLLAEILRHRGYTVLVACDGAAALAIYEKQRVSLLITDVDMPRMDGRELARRVRQMTPELPLLFMSGAVTATELAPAELSGPTRFLDKPFSFTTLVDQVEELLAGADAHPPLALHAN